MRVLLIGGSGQLGSEIVRRWRDCEITAPSHAQLDLLDAARVDDAIAAAGADVVVNCAAFHNVDRCEDEPEAAFSANALAVDAIAGACAKRGAYFVTVSTDYVFSGDATVPYTEDACPHPVSAYGASKYAGELLVQRRSSPGLIVRTCGVFGVRPSGTKGYTFVDRVIAQARNGDDIKIVDDVTASPTYAGHLAEALEQLVARRATGIVHVANVGPVTWYDFARKALELAGIDHPIQPVPQSTWTTKARRPKYSALASTRLEGFGITMPDWREGIAAYLRDKTALGV